MAKYCKKPVVIEAVQWRGDNAWEVEDVFPDWLEGGPDEIPVGKPIMIETLEGDLRCDVGDWIICGTKNEFYPCKPDIFREIYEEVND